MVSKKHMFFLLISILLISNTTGFTKLYSETQEYELKAAFVYRFIDYVEWNQNNNSEAFEICVLGESPITELLMEISKSKNKKMNIKEYYNLDDMSFCNIIFVSKSYNNPIEPVITKFSNKNVLIVTEQIGYGAKGAHINFLISENKLKFEVNLTAVKKDGLKLSSKLLEHAILISP